MSGSGSTSPDPKAAPGDGGPNRILAVDWGERRIGLAVGNRRDGLAVRLAIVDLKPGHARRPNPVAEVARHAEEEGAEALLVGLPLDGAGAEGPGVRRIRAFGEELHRATGLPIIWVDEHLTSVEAEEAARRTGWTPRSKKPLDDLAAALLLQGYFDDERARAARTRLDDDEASRAARTRLDNDEATRAARTRLDDDDDPNTADEESPTDR